MISYILEKHKSIDGSPIILDVNRKGLAALTRELGYREMVEIGTEKGLYAEQLCLANPDAHLTCVDPWLVYDEGKGYIEGTSQESFDSCYQQAKDRLSKHNVTFIRNYSALVSTWFADESIDFVYIDGNHRLEYVINDICFWEKKVRRGGVVAGHDYKKFKNQHYSHAAYAIEAYMNSYRRKQAFFITNNQDRDRSWFFVKE